MFWVVEPEITEHSPLPVGTSVMAIGLRHEGGIFEGVVRETLVSLRVGHFRVVIEFEDQNILDRYPTEGTGQGNVEEQ